MGKSFQSTAGLLLTPCCDLPHVWTFTISPFSTQLPQLNACEYVLPHVNLIEPWLRTIPRCKFTFYPHDKGVVLQCPCCYRDGKTLWRSLEEPSGSLAVRRSQGRAQGGAQLPIQLHHVSVPTSSAVETCVSCVSVGCPSHGVRWAQPWRAMSILVG